MTRASDFSREILPQVSRTFALSIRLLPGGLGDAVRNAYLICRIADTVEDEPKYPAEKKAALFDALDRCLDHPGEAAAFAARAADLTGDPAHLRLVHNASLVFEEYAALSPESRVSVRRWV